jgi:FkbM family methyltransferase
MPHERDFEVIRLLNKYENSFVDVGANQGQCIESILIFRPNAQIVAFEANPCLAEKLRRRYAARPNIRIYPTGLGDRPGEFSLYIPSYNGYVYDGLASFDRDASEGWLSNAIYGFKKSKHTVHEVQCKSETLDSFHLAPDFLKIDVQGWEYNVLIGARETLAQHEPVLLIEIYDDSRIDALLREHGYWEYYLNKGRLVAGRGPDPLNLLFVTERRIGPMVDRCNSSRHIAGRWVA